ncbi:sulfite exporter TauE/SafE family protein [Levilactobacillus suantsaii]|uniref:Probable membrane transporter protein n=1 Tax=Levilactobacillus suantsaii TaxID=2292255 RepID=A0A4V1LFF4_9LACO|nr:sulfite exporter TauE/SafE family protein [Levilactobacillus suantsaii]RXI78984.1 sulfite exporter TauE/SafE family protein [Levilactobacillus suantsaii]
MTWAFIIFPALLAGLVQGLTGFGAVIIMMIFFPSILPMAQAAGIGGVIMFVSVLGLTLRYHRYIKSKRIVIPFIVYAAVATWSVHLDHVLDAHLLRLMLGGLLVALCLYFTLVKNAGARHYPWYVAGLFMIISGFFNGLFGIGGPLMALYFLSLSRSMPEYIATIQGFFLLDAVYITSIRVANGILVAQDIPYILVGMVAAALGTLIAAHLLNRIDGETLKKWIYGFIGLSGLYYLFF